MLGRRTIKNRYRILGRLGSGDMGDVFLVEDELTGKGPLALKAISKDTGKSLRALKREFIVLSRLSHPGVARVFSFGYDPEGETHFFTSEYVDGPDFLDAAKNLSPREAAGILASVLDALDYIHARNIVHYDLKPSNIMLERSDRGYAPKLVDFGLAGPRLSREAGTFKGSLDFTAPEIMTGQEAGPQADLYSLGKTLALVLDRIRGVKPSDVELVETLERVASELSARNTLDRLESASKALKMLARAGVREASDSDNDQRLLTPVRLFERENETALLNKEIENLTRPEEEPSTEPMGRKTRIFRQNRTTEMVKRDARALVIIEGESGAGKTALADEFAAQCGLSGIEVFRASLDERRTAPPFIEIMESIATLYHDSSPAAVKLENLLQSFGKESSPGGKPLPANLRMTEFLDHAAALLVTLSRGRPIALIFESIQRIDPAGAEYLNYFVRAINAPEARWGGRVRILVVATADSAEVASPAFRRLGAELEEDGLLSRIELQPFDYDTARRFIEKVLGSQVLSDELLETVYKKSRGIPGSLVDALRLLYSRGVLERVGGQWKQTRRGAGPMARPSDPAERYHALGSTLSRNATILLKGVSLAEGAFNVHVLREISGLSGAEFLTALSELRAARVLREEDGRVSFADPGLLAHVRENLAPGVVREFHRRTIPILEKRPADPHTLAALAAHSEKAGEREKAAEYSRKAAQALLLAGDQSASLDMWRKTESLLEDLKDRASERLRVRLRVIDLLDGLGRFEEALNESREAVASLAASPLPPADAVEAYVQLGRLHERTGDLAGARQVYRRALGSLDEKRDPDAWVKLRLRLGWVMLCQGRLQDALAATLKVLGALALEDEEGPEHAEVFHAMALIYSRLGNFPQANEFFERSLDLFRRLERTRDAARVLNSMAGAAMDVPDYPAALELLGRSMEASAASGDVYSKPMALALRASAMIRLGRPGDARGPLERAIRDAERTSMKYLQALAGSAKARLMLDTGKIDEAREILRNARREFSRMEDVYSLTLASYLRAEIELEAGNIAAAESAAGTALDTARTLGSRILLARGLALYGRILARDQARREEALRTLSEALDAAEEAGMAEAGALAYAEIAGIQVSMGNLEKAKESYAGAEKLYLAASSGLRPEYERTYRKRFESRTGMKGGAREKAGDSAFADPDRTVLALVDMLDGKITAASLLQNALEAALAITSFERALFLKRGPSGFAPLATASARGGVPETDDLPALALAAEAVAAGDEPLVRNDPSGAAPGEPLRTAAFPVEPPGAAGVLYLDTKKESPALDESKIKSLERVAKLLQAGLARNEKTGPGEAGDFEFDY